VEHVELRAGGFEGVHRPGGDGAENEYGVQEAFGHERLAGGIQITRLVPVGASAGLGRQRYKYRRTRRGHDLQSETRCRPGMGMWYGFGNERVAVVHVHGVPLFQQLVAECAADDTQSDNTYDWFGQSHCVSVTVRVCVYVFWHC
jgi:hypothetical protein